MFSFNSGIKSFKYSFSPESHVINMWFKGKKIIASHSAAMMIDPDWQNKGLIKFIADKLILELDKQGIPFTYGYPNVNAYDLHLKILGYKDIVNQQLFSINSKKL